VKRRTFAVAAYTVLTLVHSGQLVLIPRSSAAKGAIGDFQSESILFLDSEDAVASIVKQDPNRVRIAGLQCQVDPAFADVLGVSDHRLSPNICFTHLARSSFPSAYELIKFCRY